jgi:hypothetical protein
MQSGGKDNSEVPRVVTSCVYGCVAEEATEIVVASDGEGSTVATDGYLPESVHTQSAVCAYNTIGCNTIHSCAES